MGDIVQWEHKEYIYVLKMIDENNSKEKKMGDQRFRASPFHTPKLKDLEHAHLSFEHVTLLLKCKFLFHGANVN